MQYGAVRKGFIISIGEIARLAWHISSRSPVFIAKPIFKAPIINDLILKSKPTMGRLILAPVVGIGSLGLPPVDSQGTGVQISGQTKPTIRQTPER